MTCSDETVPERSDLLAEYEEYDVGAATVVMLSDPTNPHAWLQSNYTVEIEP